MKLQTAKRYALTAGISILVVGCSQNPTYSLSVSTEPSTSSYSASPFPIEPAFTISPYSGNITSQGENITLTTYLDAACTIGADGGFSSTANQNVVSIRNPGIATFVDAAYAAPVHTEETIYLKGTGISTGLTACTTGISIVQHFNAGFGFVAFGGAGVNGPAGGTGTGQTDVANASVIDPQNRILVAGSSLNAASPAGIQLAVWRYFLDGTIDTSFGPSGTGYAVSSATTGAAGGTGANLADNAQAIQVDSLGNIWVAGTSKNASGGTQLALWRFTSAGILDTTFGSGSGYVVFATSGSTGAARAPIATAFDSASAMRLDSSGNIVIVGTSKNAGGGTEIAVWRYTAAGVLDTANFAASAGYLHFGTTGVAGATAGNEIDSAGGFQFDTNGKIVIAGSSKNVGGGIEAVLLRYTTAGVLDPTFGTAGHVHSGTPGAAGASNPNEIDKANSIQIDSTGNIVIAGSSKNTGGGTELALWRYSAAGAPDAAFNTAAHAASTAIGAAGGINGLENDVGNSLQIDAQGNLVIAGSSFNAANGTVLSVWRYLAAGTAAGTLDTTFNGTGNVLYGNTTQTGAAGGTAAGQFDVANTLNIDSKGRLVLTGVSKNATPGQEIALWRYLANGALDL